MSARDRCRVGVQAPDVGLPADDARADGLGLYRFDDELGAVVADAVDDLISATEAGPQLWQVCDMRGHALMAFHDRWGTREGAHPARHDFAVEVGDFVHVQAGRMFAMAAVVDDSFGAEGGEFGFDAGDVGGVADVVAHDEGAFGGGSAYEVST